MTEPLAGVRTIARIYLAHLLAAACATLGLECHLGIMRGRLATVEPGYDDTGNILLDRLFGAVIHDIPWDEDRNRRLQEIVETLKNSGRRPYLVPYGASDALGAMGYVLAAEEIVRDYPDVAWIVHASGSAGTQVDPVYTGKSMAGLIGLAQQGRFRDGGPVVWIHTGGGPGVFAYPETMARLATRD